jgi:hypothetical protein
MIDNHGSSQGQGWRPNRRQFLETAALAGLGLQFGTQASAAAGQAAPTRDGAVHLTDLDRCRPASALSTRLKRGTWKTLEYETEDFGGTMLVALEESAAPDLTYALNRSGWHRIYVGIYRKPFEQPKQVEVKLSGDPAFAIVTGRRGETDHRENWIDDIYWKSADLSGRDLLIRQTRIPRTRHGWLAYIKLVPLSAPQVESLQRDRAQKATKRLFAHTDAHFSNVSGSAEEVLKYLEPLRHTDVSRVYWEAGGGDRALYFSRIAEDYGRAFNRPDPVFPRSVDRELAVTWRNYRRNGVDPLREAAELARDMGIELHASYRTAGFVYPAPHDHIAGSFYEKHPELACLDRQGRPIPRVSYAFPETRRYVISLFREMAQYPIHGVGVLYNRRPPLVAYEEPLVRGFQARYGQDPRRLDELDPRWLAFRGQALTRFMRELRQAMDEVTQHTKRSERLAVSAVVFRPEENLLHGMDLKTWISEGLVDTIIPYSSTIRLNSYQPAWENPQDVDYYVSLVRGTRCKLALNLMPRGLTAEEYHQKAHRLYGAGVENFFFWDGISRVRKVPRLGHKEEVAAWSAGGEPPILPTAIRLRKLGEWELTLETPG